MLLQQQPPTAGQDLPSDATSTASTTATAATPTSATSADQFATDTLSSLLSAQEAPPSSASVASQVMSAVDTNGDGSLSLSEIETALGADTSTGAEASPIASAISQAFSQIDTNGDGEISSSELTTALDAQNQAQGAQKQGAQGAHHHHHHAHGGGGAPPSSTDLASQLLGSADTDGDGTLSLTEIESALGLSSTSSTATSSTSTSSTDTTSAAAATAATTTAASSTTSSNAIAALTSAFGQLDANGDGKLSASELSAGIDAFMAAHFRGAADAATQTVTA